MTLEQLLEQLNKFYGSMFEAGDFDELTKLFTLTYQEATKAEREKQDQLLTELGESTKKLKISSDFTARLAMLKGLSGNECFNFALDKVLELLRN